MAIGKDGTITDESVAFRYNGIFTEGASNLVDFIDVTPRQVVGTSASLIPFLAHDEGNRAFMGSNMQCQAVPLIAPTAPVVGTGMEGEVADAMGRVIRASHAGKVEYVDANQVEVRWIKRKKSNLMTMT